MVRRFAPPLLQDSSRVRRPGHWGRRLLRLVRSKIGGAPRRTREQRLASFVGALAFVVVGLVVSASQSWGGWEVLLVTGAVPVGGVLGHAAASLLAYLDGD